MKKKKKKAAKEKFSLNLMWRQRYLLLMSVPFVIWLIIFKYVPLWGWTMAFQEVKPGTFALPVWEREFVGLDNFVKAFTDRLFPQTMINTIGISILGIAIGTLSSILFALVLNELCFTKFKKFTQTVSYLPHFVSWVIIASIAKMLFNDGGAFDTMLGTKLHLMSTIGLTLSAADWHWMITLGNPSGYIAEGVPDNGQWLIDDKYNATYKFTSDKIREYFKWLNKMYNEGILDPEFATQTHDDYIAKISSGRVVALFDTLWDYQDGEKILKQDGKLGKTYCGLPLAMDKGTKVPTLMYQGLPTGQGVGITTACENPEAAIKFLDYICSDEGQVLVNWGIEGTNYKIDENGKRYREQEEIDAYKNDKNYSKTTGVMFHQYPFPRYGTGVEDSTGSTYTTISKESVIAEYNEEQKAACKAWGVETLLDVFPQPDEFETPDFSPVWAMSKPVEFDEIGNKLDEIAQPALISCIMEKESGFDKAYDKMISDLEGSGMKDAEKMLTEMIKDKVAVSK